MNNLTREQRQQLLDIAQGRDAGAYFVAQTVLLLGEGEDASFVAKAMFSTVEEIEEIKRLFDTGGVEAIRHYRPK